MMNAFNRERAKKKSFYIHPSTVFTDRLNLFYLPRKSPQASLSPFFWYLWIFEWGERELSSRSRPRPHWPYFQRSKAVRSLSSRSCSRWPHFQRSKAVRRPRPKMMNAFTRERAKKKSFCIHPSIVWICFIYYLGNRLGRLCHHFFLVSFDLVHVGHTFNRVEFPDGRISAEFQPKLPSACCYSACLLCHRYIILYIIVLCVLHLL